tara:strand:- start:689 stop:1015 length:327 start_codon:yes stop_codon:yes gene_type:complete
MSKRLLTSDPHSGKETWMHDNPDGGWTIETKQHIKHVLEENKKKANAYQRGQMVGNTQKHWQQVAEIPNNVYLELRQKFGEPRDNPKAWKRWLNDYDNRYFRTGGGNV